MTNPDAVSTSGEAIQTHPEDGPDYVDSGDQASDFGESDAEVMYEQGYAPTRQVVPGSTGIDERPAGPDTSHHELVGGDPSEVGLKLTSYDLEFDDLAVNGSVPPPTIEAAIRASRTNRLTEERVQELPEESRAVFLRLLSTTSIRHRRATKD